MKIKDYNQMMRHLTRPPTDDGFVKPKSMSASAPLTKAYREKLKGLPQSLKKYEGIFRKPLQEANVENLIADAVEEVRPKIMFNQGSRKFEAMDPKDDAKVNQLYYNKKATAKAIAKLADKPADVYEIEKRLELERPIAYNKDTGKFVHKQTGKSGALTDFKDEKIFEPILDRLKNPKTPAAKPVVKKVEQTPPPLPNISLLTELEEIKQLNEQSRLAEEQFKKLTQKQYDPDLEKGLGYLAGFTKETI
jgi:hypothetical protein|tara:strand:- start:4772 stop:5518 length:747 start_codon:yes stop_codon:yes gene_type:complete